MLLPINDSYHPLFCHFHYTNFDTSFTARLEQVTSYKVFEQDLSVLNFVQPVTYDRNLASEFSILYYNPMLKCKFSILEIHMYAGNKALWSIHYKIYILLKWIDYDRIN